MYITVVWCIAYFILVCLHVVMCVCLVDRLAGAVRGSAGAEV